MRHEKRRPQIHRDGRVEFVDGQSLQTDRPRDARVVDQNVDIAKGRLRFLDHPIDLFGKRHIGPRHEDGCPFGRDKPRGFLGLGVTFPVIDHDMATGSGQTNGNRSADPSTGPGNQGDLVAQLRHRIHLFGSFLVARALHKTRAVISLEIIAVDRRGDQGNRGVRADSFENDFKSRHALEMGWGGNGRFHEVGRAGILSKSGSRR